LWRTLTGLMINAANVESIASCEESCCTRQPLIVRVIFGEHAIPFTVTCGTLLALGTSGATPATTMVALRATDVEMTALRPFIL
jgi:hypothetical protein